MILRHFQRCGHKPLALIGGATGMIGDPSGTSAERNLLTEETLQRNLAGMKAQLSKFLDFDSDAPNRAELVNNYDWMKNFTFLDFAREVGKMCIRDRPYPGQDSCHGKNTDQQEGKYTIPSERAAVTDTGGPA